MNPRLLYAAALFSPISLAMILRSEALGPIITAEYSPRRDQYLAHPWLLWTTVGTNLLVALSYLLFIIGIVWLVRRFRNIPELRGHLWILSTLIVFFLARWATTVLSILKVWWPLYNFSIVLNIVCAFTSVPAAIAFVWRAPVLGANIARFFHLLKVEQDHAEALRKSEDFLDRTSRITGAGGWEFDLRTRRVTWSAQTYRIHGAPPDFQPVLEEILKRYKPEARPLVEAAIAAAIANGKAWDLELPVTTLDGRDIWVRSVGVPDMLEGSTVRLVGALQDITSIVETRNALKQALESEQSHAEALRKSEEFLDLTSRLAGVGGWELDLLTDTLTWSAETHRILGAPAGYSPTLAEGLSMYKSEARDAITAAIDAAAATGQAWDLELPITTFDGRDIWARCVGAAELRGGKAVRLVGAFQDITSIVETRNALRQANERIEIATDSGGIGIWDWDIVTGDLFCDKWMHRLHGKDPREPDVDGLWRDHLHPGDKERIARELGEAIAGGPPYDSEFRIVWPDGSVHHLRGSARVTLGSDGSPLRMVGVNWDITAMVEARDALRVANERAALAVDSGGIGIFVFDLENGLCTCDDWMYRLHDLERTGETTPLEFWTQHMHPEDTQNVLDALNAAIAGPEPYNTEYRVIWNDGSIHYLRATGKISRNQEGKAVSMIGTNWDVTESRRLTNQLAEQHELLHITLKSIGDGVITTDTERNVAWLNPAAERMTGWSTADVIGEPIGRIFNTLNEDTREPIENPLANYIAQGNAAGIARNTLLVSHDGTEFGIESSVAPIRNTFGDLLGNVLVFRDVTEQRRLAAETDRNAQLKIQLKLKDEFLSHVSHELRSPLSSIYSFTSIIADNLAGDITPEQADYLHIILKNVTQLQSMIEDLLTVTQSREGKLPIEPQSLSVAEAITDSLHTVQGAAAEKNIALSSDVPDELPAAYADPIRLRQILIILLDNAIKFTPPEGKIAVVASFQDSRTLLLQVSDTGCGIPPDKRSLVFENLYQVRGPEQPDTSQAGRTGLGLGLHIAKNLVNRQGGTIWVTEAPVTGSIFHFTLPAFVESTSSFDALEPEQLALPSTAHAA